MNSLRTLLQNADPLRHEVPRLDAERDGIQQTILGSTPVERSTTSMRPRLRLAAALAVVVTGVVALGYRNRSDPRLAIEATEVWQALGDGTPERRSAQ